MLEATPKKPFEGITSLCRIEDHMRLRRSRLLAQLLPGEICPTLAVFPLLGVGKFWTQQGPGQNMNSCGPQQGQQQQQVNQLKLQVNNYSESECNSNSGTVNINTINSNSNTNCNNKAPQIIDSNVNGPVAQSLFVPDDIIYPHARFATLTKNIRQRRGEKVHISRPKFIDENTYINPNLRERSDIGVIPRSAYDADNNGSRFVYADAMAFGMGCCCLQVTFQAANLQESRFLYDHLAVLTPILMCMTAASPYLRGWLMDEDVRWGIVSQSVDDRRPVERGLRYSVQQVQQNVSIEEAQRQSSLSQQQQQQYYNQNLQYQGMIPGLSISKSSNEINNGAIISKESNSPGTPKGTMSQNRSFFQNVQNLNNNDNNMPNSSFHQSLQSLAFNNNQNNNNINLNNPNGPNRIISSVTPTSPMMNFNLFHLNSSSQELLKLKQQEYTNLFTDDPRLAGNGTTFMRKSRYAGIDCYISSYSYDSLNDIFSGENLNDYIQDQIYSTDINNNSISYMNQIQQQQSMQYSVGDDGNIMVNQTDNGGGGGPILDNDLGPHTGINAIDRVISKDAPENYNDLHLEFDKAHFDRLILAGVDRSLARHVAHLFCRDPLVIFQDRIFLDNRRNVDHWENLQSTNWQSVRWKPPHPKNSQEDKYSERHIGWRVEFRTMEIQLTDFENAAFTVFTILISRVLLALELNLYIPISLLEVNMQRAHRRDAVHKQRFWFRKNLLPPIVRDSLSSTQQAQCSRAKGSQGQQQSDINVDRNAFGINHNDDNQSNYNQQQQSPQASMNHNSNGPQTTNKTCSSPQPIESEYLEMTVEEIMLGKYGEIQSCYMNKGQQGPGNSNTTGVPNSDNNTTTSSKDKANGPTKKSTTTAICLFPGLIPLCRTYLEFIGIDSVSYDKINSYLEFISLRASGKVLTIAQYLRHFVRSHPSYKKDSRVPQDCAHDLCLKAKRIGEGLDLCPELLGNRFAKLIPRCRPAANPFKNAEVDRVRGLNNLQNTQSSSNNLTQLNSNNNNKYESGIVLDSSGRNSESGYQQVDSNRNSPEHLLGNNDETIQQQEPPINAQTSDQNTKFTVSDIIQSTDSKFNDPNNNEHNESEQNLVPVTRLSSVPYLTNASPLECGPLGYSPLASPKGTQVEKSDDNNNDVETGPGVVSNIRDISLELKGFEDEDSKSVGVTVTVDSNSKQTQQGQNGPEKGNNGKVSGKVVILPNPNNTDTTSNIIENKNKSNTSPGPDTSDHSPKKTILTKCTKPSTTDSFSAQQAAANHKRELLNSYLISAKSKRDKAFRYALHVKSRELEELKKEIQSIEVEAQCSQNSRNPADLPVCVTAKGLMRAHEMLVQSRT